jgi:ABC-type lipoprotein export system ATPase subunit
VYQLTGVTKLYRKGRHTVRAVNGLGLTIGDGEWLAVQGRTGHGKSTLLNLLGGLDRPTEGTIELDGTDLGAQAETQLTRLRAQLIGFIFQTFNLIPTLSAAENVETALIPLGISGAGRQARIASALDAVGLADRAGHRPAELSGGVKGDGEVGGGSRSPAPWSRSPGFCWLTSRPATLTPPSPAAQHIGIMNEGRLTIRQGTTPGQPTG